MTVDPTPSLPAADQPWAEVYNSRDFPGWLASQRVSLAFTTYQTAKLFFIGLQPGGQMTDHAWTFNRWPMALGFASDEIQRLLSIGDEGVL